MMIWDDGAGFGWNDAVGSVVFLTDCSGLIDLLMYLDGMKAMVRSE